MEYYLISSIQYPQEIFTIINGNLETLLEEGLTLREKNKMPSFEAGMTMDSDIDLTRSSKAFYQINQIGGEEALFKLKKYKKQQ